MPAINLTDLTNAKTDVDHIAAVATSTAPTATDRLGGVKKTMAGITVLMDAQVALVTAAKTTAVTVTIPAQVALVTAAKDTAVNTTIPAAVALVDAAVAATYVGQAGAAKVAAETAAAAAAVNAAAAAASKVLAENAAALAATGAKFYDTIALGRAGVADTFTFGVKAGGSDALLRPSVYRRDSSSTQTLLYAVLPASEFDQYTYVRSLKWTSGSGDANGNLGFAVDLSGASISDRQAYQSGGTYDYDINFFPVYGQSLAVGNAIPALSTVQNFDNLMFVDGLRPQYDHVADSDAVRYASFVPAVEEQSAVNVTLGETSCLGMGDTIKELMLAEDGLSHSTQSYQMLLSAPGFGATAIAGLAKGNTHYTRIMTQATYGAANAATLNKTFAVQAVAYGQGEQDYLIANTQATYYAALNQLVADLNTDLKVITGQTKSIPLICYQIASHKVGGQATPAIALAQLQAANANALVRIACPMYMFRYQSTNDFHLRAVESRELGAYFGLAYKRVVIDGMDWKPLQPTASVKSGKIAVVTFNVPVGALVLDTALVEQNTNYGFELVTSAGAALTIDSVSLRGRNQVKVVAAATIPAGAKLRYAWSGTSNVGRLTGPRGNLRDQQGDDTPGRKGVKFDPNGINKPMHNWCVIFEWSL